MVILPAEELTLTEKARLRQSAVQRGIRRAIDGLHIRSNDAQLTYRHPQNIADFGTVGREQWLTATIAAINTPYSVWTTLAAPAVGLTPQLATTRLAVFWGAAIGTVPNPVTLLSFREGAAAGTTMAVFDLETLEPYLVNMGYFSEPVVYDPQAVLNVVVTSKLAPGAQAQVILYCYIIEPKGPVIS